MPPPPRSRGRATRGKCSTKRPGRSTPRSSVPDAEAALIMVNAMHGAPEYMGRRIAIRRLATPCVQRGCSRKPWRGFRDVHLRDAPSTSGLSCDKPEQSLPLCRAVGVHPLERHLDSSGRRCRVHVLRMVGPTGQFRPGTWTFRTFHGPMTGAAGNRSTAQRDIDDLGGTATYRGPAVGQYSFYQPLFGVWRIQRQGNAQGKLR